MSAKSRWPDWTGETVVCVASGPSLTADQCYYLAQLTGLKIIAVNECGLIQYRPLSVPWCDILYAADAKFWKAYDIRTDALKVSADETDKADVRIEVVSNQAPMPREPGKLVPGDHSGFQALGLALTLGASRIVLLGYDCGGPKRNCHSNRPANLTTTSGSFHNKNSYYVRAKREWPDVEIVNCSRLTTLTAFPVLPLREVIP